MKEKGIPLVEIDHLCFNLLEVRVTKTKLAVNSFIIAWTIED
jgi:hypothetical protein